MPFDPTGAPVLLARTPGVLRELLTDLPAAWLHANEGGESWSAFTVLGHLIHGEKTDWIPRARIILPQGEFSALTLSNRIITRTPANRPV